MTPYIVGIVIAQAVISGGLCGYLAEQKGYSTGAWFFLGFLFRVFGLIACAGLPAANTSRDVYNRDESLVKRCPRCAELVKIEASVCRFCQHEFDDRARAIQNLKGVLAKEVEAGPFATELLEILEYLGVGPEELQESAEKQEAESNL